jgi:hypothetical protein
MFTGVGMNVAAEVGIAAIKSMRTKKLMTKVNNEFFGPRGLKVSICKNKELPAKLGQDAAPLDVP